MFRLVSYELKKLWNKVTILAILSMVLLCTTLYLLMIFDYSNLTIKSNGETVRGVRAYRVLKEESKDIKGVMNQDYLDELVKKYNTSKEKQLFNNGEYPLIKYKFPNFLINFAHYGQSMGNFYIDLDFDFLKSEKIFYNQYKDTVKTLIKSKNKEQGIIKYTEKQIDRINKQVDNIKTPFKVSYDEGLSNFVGFYGEKYWIVLIVIAFALSTIFSKDSNNGIDELSLSSAFGRKKDMNARIIAGNIFATVAYGIFVCTLFIVIGLVGSLEGWNESAQMFWYICPYNISFGSGILIMLFMGLLGVIIVANIIMLISINFRNSKVSTLFSVVVVCILLKLTQTGNQLQLQLNPIFFGTHFTTTNLTEFEIFYFIGEIMIPYSIIILILFVIYMIIIRFLTLKSYKKYRLN